MERENLFRAQIIINKIEHLEHVQKLIEKSEEYRKWENTYFFVKFKDGTEYTFPESVELSIFQNIFDTSVKGELKRLNDELKSL